MDVLKTLNQLSQDKVLKREISVMFDKIFDLDHENERIPFE